MILIVMCAVSSSLERGNMSTDEFIEAMDEIVYWLDDTEAVLTATVDTADMPTLQKLKNKIKVKTRTIFFGNLISFAIYCGIQFWADMSVV